MKSSEFIRVVEGFYVNPHNIQSINYDPNVPAGKKLEVWFGQTVKILWGDSAELGYTKLKEILP